MQPILLDWGPFFVPAWHLFVALGGIAALFALLKMRMNFFPQVDADNLRTLFAICYGVGLLGSRLAEIIVTKEAQTLGEFFEKLFSFGGMLFYGGVILGLCSGWIYCHIKKLDTATILDLGVPALFLGLMFGRIGCFLNGDDYGKPGPESSLFTVIFPNLGDNTPRYATQLMESVFALALFFLALWLFKKPRKAPGQTGLLLLILYGCFRFFIEYLRDDPRGFFFLPALSTSQGISMLICIVGLTLLFRARFARTNA